MKKIILTAILGTNLLLAASVTASNAVTASDAVTAPVGPAPQASAVTRNASDSGQLVVYSAYTVTPDFNSQNSFYHGYHSSYRILSRTGTLLKRVKNDDSLPMDNPTSVSLPPGHYQVMAHANGYGTLTIPVVIEPGRTTVLHLEGGSPWPNPSAFSEANSVRLPDGRIIGWREKS